MVLGHWTKLSGFNHTQLSMISKLFLSTIFKQHFMIREYHFQSVYTFLNEQIIASAIFLTKSLKVEKNK